MDHTAPLLSGRLSRTGLSWLAVAVLAVTPLESISRELDSVYIVLAARSLVLLVLLLGLRSERIGPVNAGRVFLALGLCDMVAAAVASASTPEEIVIESIAYGTILSILTLLIAPSETRQRWSLAVVAFVAATAAVRLLPDDGILLLQVAVVFAVHTSAMFALDVHANRAEAAGAMATIDPLTGLLNRRPAIEEMRVALASAARGEFASSLIMADLDHFKQLNDTLGHEAGDDALRRVAAALSALVDDGDTLCRWGGEEFLILLPEADSEVASQIAERMRCEVEQLGVTASFGVAQAAVTNTVAEWVDRADSAMYLAKHNGRNRIFLDDHLAHTLHNDHA